MSIHPTLKVSTAGAKHRNVLKRYERIKKLKADEKWVDERSVFNLPKVKSIKIRAKSKSDGKEKAAEEGKPAAAAAPAGKK